MVGVGFAAVSALGAAGQLASGLMSAQARRAQFDEQLRQLEFKKQQTLGIAKARAAASGIEMNSSSTVDYLAGLTGEFDRELAALRAGRSVTSQMDTLTNISNLSGSGAQTYMGLAQLNNFWR